MFLKVAVELTGGLVKGDYRGVLGYTGLLEGFYKVYRPSIRLL